MIVVADTSPINHLILIDAVRILPELYQTIFVPEAVFDELQAEETPEKVRDWIKNLPAWFNRQLSQITVVLCKFQPVLTGFRALRTLLSHVRSRRG